MLTILVGSYEADMLEEKIGSLIAEREALRARARKLQDEINALRRQQWGTHEKRSRAYELVIFDWQSATEVAKALRTSQPRVRKLVLTEFRHRYGRNAPDIAGIRLREHYRAQYLGKRKLWGGWSRGVLLRNLFAGRIQAEFGRRTHSDWAAEGKKDPLDAPIDVSRIAELFEVRFIEDEPRYSRLMLRDFIADYPFYDSKEISSWLGEIVSVRTASVGTLHERRCR